MLLDEMKSLVLEKTLVSIEREDISSDEIKGVIVDYNENFVLVRYMITMESLIVLVSFQYIKFPQFNGGIENLNALAD